MLLFISPCSAVKWGIKMKFMTKEWYETMQRTDFHLLLKATKNAAVFSEEYFRNLYNDKERAWLRLMKNIFKVSFKDFYPEEFYIDDNLVHFLTPEQLGEEKRIFSKNVSRHVLILKRGAFLFQRKKRKTLKRRYCIGLNV